MSRGIAAVGDLIVTDSRYVENWGKMAALIKKSGVNSRIADCVEGDSVLELGSGPGNLLYLFRKRLKGKFARVVGVDISPGMIDAATEYLSGKGCSVDTLVSGRLVGDDGKKPRFVFPEGIAEDFSVEANKDGVFLVQDNLLDPQVIDKILAPESFDTVCYVYPGFAMTRLMFDYSDREHGTALENAGRDLALRFLKKGGVFIMGGNVPDAHTLGSSAHKTKHNLTFWGNALALERSFEVVWSSDLSVGVKDLGHVGLDDSPMRASIRPKSHFHVIRKIR